MIASAIFPGHFHKFPYQSSSKYPSASHIVHASFFFSNSTSRIRFRSSSARITMSLVFSHGEKHFGILVHHKFFYCAQV